MACPGPALFVAGCRLLAALVLMTLVAMASTDAAAAPPGQAAKEDTLGRAVFGFLRPTYITTYIITDQQSAWDQKFSFQNTFGFFNLESETSFNVKTDPNRTNFRATSGISTNRLRYNILDRIPISANVVYSRDGTDDTNDFSRRSATNAGFDASYKWRPRKGVDVRLLAGVGLNSRKDNQTLQGDESGVTETGTDYTTEAGIGWNLLRLGMSSRLDATRNASSTRSKITPEDPLAPPNDAKENSRSSINGNWSWLPNDMFESSARMDFKTLHDNFILVSRDTTLNGRSESQTNLNRSFGVTTKLKDPNVQTNELSLDLSTGDNSVARAVELDRSSEHSSQAAAFKARGTLKRNMMEANVRLQHDEDSSPIRAPGTTVNRTIDGSFSRPLTSTLTSRFVAETSLRTQKSDDRSNDQDIQKLRGESTFTWEPASKKFRTIIGGRANRTSVVYIDSTQSGSSRNEENYGGTVDFTWTVSARTRVTQLYDFRVLLTTFRFNAPNDNLQVTRDIRTSVYHQLRKGVAVEVNHSYRYQQSGRYRLLAGGGRIFSRTDDRYDQDLRLGLSWTATTWLSFRTDEIFHRDDNVTLASRTRTTNRRLEFNQSAQINRTLPGKGSLACTITYRARQLTSSTGAQPSEDFLNVNLSLTKPF